jgi:hypothetical protein
VTCTPRFFVHVANRRERSRQPLVLGADDPRSALGRDIIDRQQWFGKVSLPQSAAQFDLDVAADL